MKNLHILMNYGYSNEFIMRIYALKKAPVTAGFTFSKTINQIPFSFVPRNVFYQISTPFLMDSQTTNWLNEKLGIEKKRKRKRKHKEIAEYIGEV